MASKTVKPRPKDLYPGYRGEAFDALKKFGVRPGDIVDVETARGRFHGLIMPRDDGDEQHWSLRLSSGYIVGLPANEVTSVKQVGHHDARAERPAKKFPFHKEKPGIHLFLVGEPVAPRLDLFSGTPRSATTPGEVYATHPEIFQLCNLNISSLFATPTENLGAADYATLAKGIAEKIAEGAAGIVVAHGAATLATTAAAIAFMLPRPPVPVIFAGSQRPADRAAWDGRVNLYNAVKAAAEGDIAEVAVCVPAASSDLYSILHRATRVRAFHASARGGFRSAGDLPLARVDAERVAPLRADYHRRGFDRELVARTAFESRVGLIYFYANMDRDAIDALVDRGYRGLIIAGAGTGLVNRPCVTALKRAQEAGVVVFMTTQAPWGRADLTSSETGRELERLGVVAARDTLPEVAYVKLCWALGQTSDADEVKGLMLTSLAGEFTEREPLTSFTVLQSGLPEVEEFFGSHWR